MKFIKNNAACFYTTDHLYPSIVKLCSLVENYACILKPFRGSNEEVRTILSKEGFDLFPTVKKTTLFFDPVTDCFFKILHPLSIKNRLINHFLHRDRYIYKLSEHLRLQGIKAPVITAYGRFKRSKKPFYVAERAKGRSLYDILVREGKTLDTAMWLNVIDHIARLHSLGYWLGDAHLSHIFVNDSGVTCIIDIDSIRKNRPFLHKNLAKDLAGLNHPEVILTKDEKRKLIDYYTNKLHIRDKDVFLRLIDEYSERRWKA